MGDVDRVVVEVWPDTRSFEKRMRRITEKRRTTIIEAVLKSTAAKAELKKLEKSRTEIDLYLGTDQARKELEKLRGSLSSLGDQFQQATQSSFAGAADDASSLADALGPVGDLVDQFAPKLSDVLMRIGEVSPEALTKLADTLAQPAIQSGILAGIEAIQDGLVQIDWASFGEAAGEAGRLIAAAVPPAVEMINALAPYLPGLVAEATSLVKAFGDLPTSLQLAVVAAKELGPTVAGAVDAAFAKIKGESLGAALKKYLTDDGKVTVGAGLKKYLTKTLPDLFSGLMKWLVTAIPAAVQLLSKGLMAIPGWGWILAAIVAVVGALVWFFTQTDVGIAAWSGFMTWLGDAWQSISALAVQVWGDITKFFTDVWDGILAAPQAVVDWFNGTFVPFFLGLPEAIWNGFLGIIEFFVSLPGQIIGALLTGLAAMIEFWSNLFVVTSEAIAAGIAATVQFFIDLPGNIVAAVTWLMEELPGFFARVWTATTEAVAYGIDAVMQFFLNLPTNIVNAVTSLLAMLTSFWGGVWETVGKLVGAGITAVVTFFTELPGKIFSALAPLGGQIMEAIQRGMGTGNTAALNGVRDVVASVAKLPGKAAAALNNIGSTLANAGRALMQGFWDGAKRVWENVQTWVGGLADWIASHKGPLTYDYRLLQPAGRAIMGGFKDAMQDGMREVESMVSKFAPTVASSFDATASSGVGNSTSLTIGTLAAGGLPPHIQDAVERIVDYVGSEQPALAQGRV